MATENQKIIAARVLKKVRKGGKNTRAISISREMRESGVYSPSVTKHPEKLTGSKGWKELMERYLPDESLAEVHTGLLGAKRLDQLIFPKESDLSDGQIKDLVESSFGCALKRISRGKMATYVFFYAPDNKARNDALDKAYKLKGRYAPLRVYTEPDPLEDLPDEELDKQLRDAEEELKRRQNGSKEEKVAPARGKSE